MTFIEQRSRFKKVSYTPPLSGRLPNNGFLFTTFTLTKMSILSIFNINIFTAICTFLSTINSFISFILSFKRGSLFILFQLFLLRLLCHTKELKSYCEDALSPGTGQAPRLKNTIVFSKR